MAHSLPPTPRSPPCSVLDYVHVIPPHRSPMAHSLPQRPGSYHALFSIHVAPPHRHQWPTAYPSAQVPRVCTHERSRTHTHTNTWLTCKSRCPPRVLARFSSRRQMTTPRYVRHIRRIGTLSLRHSPAWARTSSQRCPRRQRCRRRHLPARGKRFARALPVAPNPGLPLLQTAGHLLSNTKF